LLCARSGGGLPEAPCSQLSRRPDAPAFDRRPTIFAKDREVILFNNAGGRFAKSRRIAFHVLYGRQQ
jgi:hypothetical protein